MTVENQTIKKRVNADNTTNPISFSFHVQQEDDLSVYKILLSTGVATLLTGGGVDYSVDLEDDNEGGFITPTAGIPATYDILLINEADITQPQDFPTEGSFNEESVEDGLDRACIINLIQQEEINRCLKLKTEDVLNTTNYDGLYIAAEATADRESRFLVWNEDGDEIEAGPLVADLDTITANIGDIVTVADNIGSVQTCAANIANINIVAGIAADTDLTAIAALSGTGLAARTGSGTWATRTATGTANEITVTNGDGVSGNPTFSLPAAMTLTGKTLTGGTYSSPILAGSVSVGSAAFSGAFTLTGGGITNVDTTGGGSSFLITNGGGFSVTGTGGGTISLETIGSGSITISSPDITIDASTGIVIEAGLAYLMSGSDSWLMGASDIAIQGGQTITLESNAVMIGTAALATTATTGFLWIPSCAGTPTGAATAPYTNAAGLVYDRTNNKLYIRQGGTWRGSAAFT